MLEPFQVSGGVDGGDATGLPVSVRKLIPLNNNRNNNNRRRGRGNNRGPGGGGGNQGNRIDSRARGNAPQLLEKYRKLAHDASLNDDRVQTEYYLQFADHYFRVLADSRTQKDDGRGRRDNDRDQSFDNQDDDEDEVEVEETSRARPPRGRRERTENARAEAPADEGSPGIEGDEDRGDSGDEPENPFLRDTRSRRPRTRSRAAERNEDGASENAGDREGVDPGVLPPSISRATGDNNDAAGEQPRGEQAERPRPARRRRARPADNGDAEALEAVS